jgi:hypothetical protein
MKKRKKRRPEIMKPGLKQLTPLEAKVVQLMLADMKQRWADLLARNKWRAGK